MNNPAASREVSKPKTTAKVSAARGEIESREIQSRQQPVGLNNPHRLLKAKPPGNSHSIQPWRSILTKSENEFAYLPSFFCGFPAPVLHKEFVGAKSDKLLEKVSSAAPPLSNAR